MCEKIWVISAGLWVGLSPQNLPDLDLILY